MTNIHSDTKYCLRCKTEKFLDEFYYNRNQQDGYNFYCKMCSRSINKAFYARTRGAETAKKRAEKRALMPPPTRKCRTCKNHFTLEHFAPPERGTTTSFLCQICFGIREEKRKRIRIEKTLLKKQRSPKPKVREYLSQSPWIRAKYKMKDRLRKYTPFKSKVGLKNDEFKAYLESLFVQGISWENFGNNYGCWAVRWIKQPQEFNLSDPKEVMKINHYTNLKIYQFPKGNGKPWKDKTPEEKRTAITKQRIWQRKNQKKIKVYRRNFLKTPHGRIVHNIRTRLRAKVKNIQYRISLSKSVGKNSRQLKEYLESKFQPGMNWANYGWGNDKWNVDHIRPIASFDVHDPEQLKLINHYSNLQPLWQPDNIAKRDRWTPPN